MDQSTFESANPILDEIAAKLDEVLDSDQFAFVRLLLARLSETIGPRYSVNLNVSVDVFDTERSNALPLLTLGFSTSEGKSPSGLMVTQLPRDTSSMARSKSSLTTTAPSVMGCGTSSSKTRPARSAGRLWVEKSSCSSTTISVRSARRERCR